MCYQNDFCNVRWKASFYLTLPVFVGSEPVQTSKRQGKRASRQIRYLNTTIKTGQRSQTLDVTSQNPKSIHSATTRSKLKVNKTIEKLHLLSALPTSWKVGLHQQICLRILSWRSTKAR